jgi:hypothetical protein
MAQSYDFFNILATKIAIFDPKFMHKK